LEGFLRVKTRETLRTQGRHPMKQQILGATLGGKGTVIGVLFSANTNGTDNAQFPLPRDHSGQRCGTSTEVL